MAYDFLSILLEIEAVNNPDKQIDTNSKAAKIALMLQSLVWPFYVIRANLFYKETDTND